MILSESEKYGFIRVFLGWFFCRCSFLPPHPLLCTVCSSLAATIPLYPCPLPSTCIPLLFPFLFSFLFLVWHSSTSHVSLQPSVLCKLLLPSPACIIMAEVLRKNSSSLSEEYLIAPRQWEETKERHHQVVQPRVWHVQCISPSSRCLGCQTLWDYCLLTH